MPVSNAIFLLKKKLTFLTYFLRGKITTNILLFFFIDFTLEARAIDAGFWNNFKFHLDKQTISITCLIERPWCTTTHPVFSEEEFSSRRSTLLRWKGRLKTRLLRDFFTLWLFTLVIANGIQIIFSKQRSGWTTFAVAVQTCRDNQEEEMIKSSIRI